MAGLDPAIHRKRWTRGVSSANTRFALWPADDDIKFIVHQRIRPMSKPKVLISDALSPAAVQIFKDRGIDVDFQPNLGKDKDKLAEIIGNYDGLAIRSATKATAKIIEKATRLKVIGRAGIGCGNIGSIVADRALGLRMKVIAFDPFLSPERARDIGVEKVELDDLLKRADFITLHTPLTEKTRNIIDAPAF